MNYIYPAIFYPEANGKYSVIFPDLNDLRPPMVTVLQMPLPWHRKHVHNICLLL